MLNGKALHRLNCVTHLACKMTTAIHGLPKDIMEKRGQYVNRVNEVLFYRLTNKYRE